MFTWHRNFSANCFRATKIRDFTVPAGMPSRLAISSMVWPSMAASKSTRRSFSGNSARARSRCAWNSFEAARSSAVAAGGWCAGCDQSTSRCSRRFAERKRSSARRNEMRTSQARKRLRSRRRSKLRYARRSASWATSSASAVLRRTPRATRYASGPHSARRASNSRVASAWAASRADSFPSVPLGWIRTSSCIGLPVKARTLLFRAATMHSKSRAIPVQLPDAAAWDLVQQEMAPLRCDGLDAQLFEERFEVGIVDRDFNARLTLGGRLDDAFIKRLEEAHFGYGVFLAAGERAAVFPGTGFHRGLVDENLEAEGGLAVDGNGVGKFAAGAAIALGAVSLEEIILIDVAVGGGVALDAADSIGARHAGLFVGGGRMSTLETSAGNSEMALERGRRVPDWDRRRRVRRHKKRFCSDETAHRTGTTSRFTCDYRVG